MLNLLFNSTLLVAMLCGRRMGPQARIIGGEQTSFGRWPWQISLRSWRSYSYMHKCGASLISEHWAITAAHCIISEKTSDLLLRLGDYDMSQSQSEKEPYAHLDRRIELIETHPLFDSRTYENDLALLKFTEPVNFQPNIVPVCLIDYDDDLTGKDAYVTGWGRLYEGGPMPSILQEAVVPIIENKMCENLFRKAGGNEYIPYIFICAGRANLDSCDGDSGGPMVLQRDDKRFQLIGIISWGIGCGEPNQPGVYTRISEYKDWIRDILNNK